MLTYKSYDTEYKIKLQITEYQDGQFALNALCWDDELNFWDNFGTITVNLNYTNNDPAPENCAYVDTNNMPDIEDWLKENKIAEYTGKKKVSGYCTYPLYKFDIQRIKSIIAEYDKEQ